MVADSKCFSSFLGTNTKFSHCRCEGLDFSLAERQESPGDTFSQEPFHLDGWDFRFMESLSCSTPTSLQSSWMRLNSNGFVSRSAGFRSIRIFTTSTRRSHLATCGQRCLACSLTCCVVHTLVVACHCHTRVFFWVSEASLGLEVTTTYNSLAHDESDTAFRLLDQFLRSHPLCTSTPSLIERLSSRSIAAQSLSVYAMMWSDRVSKWSSAPLS